MTFSVNSLLDLRNEFQALAERYPDFRVHQGIGRFVKYDEILKAVTLCPTVHTRNGRSMWFSADPPTFPTFKDEVLHSSIGRKMLIEREGQQLIDIHAAAIEVATKESQDETFARTENVDQQVTEWNRIASRSVRMLNASGCCESLSGEEYLDEDGTDWASFLIDLCWERVDFPFEACATHVTSDDDESAIWQLRDSPWRVSIAAVDVMIGMLATPPTGGDRERSQPQGPISGNRFRHEGKTIDLTPVQWRLVKSMWGHETRDLYDVIDEVWVDFGLRQPENISPDVSRLNSRLTKVGYPDSIRKPRSSDLLTWT